MTITECLIEKSKEAFVMAIEIYNKPSIHYRLEGFSFFICNAWELMLKAYLIKRDGDNAVYYRDKPNRTISLENCIQKIFTNEKAPLRKNLEKIVELRNTSTHFITEEYEALYIPLLQACVFNYVEKMHEFHQIDMTEVIPENFITLSVRLKSLNETEIRAKYSNQIAEKFFAVQNHIEPLIDQENNAFAIKIEHYHYATKNPAEATEKYYIDKNAAEGVRIIKEVKNPNDTHKYTMKAVNDMVNKRLSKENLVLLDNKGEPCRFNHHYFQLFAKYFGIKDNERLCFVYHVSSQPQYSYSQQVIDFIVDEIKKAPSTIIRDLKDKIKKSTPGAKDSKC